MDISIDAENGKLCEQGGLKEVGPFPTPSGSVPAIVLATIARSPEPRGRPSFDTSRWEAIFSRRVTDAVETGMNDNTPKSAPPTPSAPRVQFADVQRDAGAVMRQADHAGRAVVVDRSGAPRIVVHSHVGQAPPFDDE